VALCALVHGRSAAGTGPPYLQKIQDSTKTPAECLKEWQEFYQLAEMGKRAIVEGRVYPHQTHQVGTVAHDDVTDRQVEDDTESTG